VKDKFRAIINSYSEIFFIRGIVPGCILLTISFINFNCALSGLIAVLSAYFFAIFIGYKVEFLSSGFFTYNALLVGFSIGQLFQLNYISLIFLIIASLLTFIVTIVLSHIFNLYFRLQILSLPFVCVSSFVYLSAGRFSNLYVTSMHTSPVQQSLSFLPDWVNGFFQSIGAIIFMPNTISGILIMVMILFSSRILFLLAIMGFAVGSVINGMFIGSIPQAMTDLNNFNYILIAMGLGGIFLIPSIQSYLIAMFGVAISTILISSVNVFWAQYGIPVFTLPFTMVTLSFVYVLGLVQYQKIPLIFKATPEETLDHFLTSQNRFPTEAITVNLPFTGNWTVWQGFDSKWTHQGIWKYGYDFIISNEASQNFIGDGTRLDQYLCFKKEVLSPVQGRVVKVVNYLPDNPIGTVDSINNWGNMILIYESRGVYVELSHFSQHSITVKEGDWLEPGTFIGLCGNSGYSPQPHIHMQVQLYEPMGSATFPYTFVHYASGNTYHSHGNPKEGTVVTNLITLPFYDQLSTFVLDESFYYSVKKKGIEIGELSITVKMAPDSTIYLSTKLGKLYLGKINGTFYAFHIEGTDPFLRYILLAIPKFPLHYRPQLEWTDAIPSATLFTGWKKEIVSLINAFYPKLSESSGSYKFSSDTEIIGTVKNKLFNEKNTSYVKLDPMAKIDIVKWNDIEIRRKLS
jgi:urea transporter